jgi:hypothetical protein
MKLKFIISVVIICFFVHTKIGAQCQVIRTMTADSSSMSFYDYNKQNKLTSIKGFYIYEGNKSEFETSFSYNEQNKVILSSHILDGKIFRTRQFSYKNNRLDGIVDTYHKDTSVFKGTFFYNEKGQLSKVYRKSNKGDTLVNTFEWANEGWFKRLEVRTNYAPIGNGFAIENAWDQNNTIKDPDRMFFEGQELDFSLPFLMPHSPLSVKGNITTQTYFEFKNGVFEKDDVTELFDFKANDSGYLKENKYKEGNKIQTFINQYKGCKN